MRATAVFLVLAVLCAAAAEDAVTADAPDAAPKLVCDEKDGVKRCYTPPHDECIPKPPLPCLADMHHMHFKKTCRPFVIDKDPRRTGDIRVGDVCLEIVKDPKTHQWAVDVDIFLHDKYGHPMDCDNKPIVDTDFFFDKDDKRCHDWRMLDTHFWMSPDFDSVKTSPAGAPLVAQFPFVLDIDHNGKHAHKLIPLVQILGWGYDWDRICFDILWFAATANLVCDSPDSDIDPDDCNAAWAQGAHFQETRDVDGQYAYVEILCNEECFEWPRDKNPFCATSYAVAVPDCDAAHSKCFTHFMHEHHHFTMWGWANKITRPGHYTFDLFSGGTSCGCDLDDPERTGPTDKNCHCKPGYMGRLVGNVYVDFQMISPPYGKEVTDAALSDSPKFQAAEGVDAPADVKRRDEVVDASPMSRPQYPKFGRVIVSFATKPGYYLEETEVHVSSKFPLPFTHWDNDWFHPATFPRFYWMPWPEHEQLHTRVDEYVATVIFDGKNLRCVREEAAQAVVEEAPKAPVDDKKPEVSDEDLSTEDYKFADVEASWEKTTCGGGGYKEEVFVIAHAMVCKGDVIMVPHEKKHFPVNDPPLMAPVEAAPEAAQAAPAPAPATEQARKKK